MEVIREPQTKEEWEQAYIVVLQRAHDAERALFLAMAALRKFSEHCPHCKAVVDEATK